MYLDDRFNENVRLRSLHVLRYLNEETEKVWDVMYRIYQALRPGSTFLWQDLASSSIARVNKSHPPGSLLYTISFICCITSILQKTCSAEDTLGTECGNGPPLVTSEMLVSSLTRVHMIHLFSFTSLVLTLQTCLALSELINRMGIILSYTRWCFVSFFILLHHHPQLCSTVFFEVAHFFELMCFLLLILSSLCWILQRHGAPQCLRWPWWLQNFCVLHIHTQYNSDCAINSGLLPFPLPLL